jgi:TolB-like protein
MTESSPPAAPRGAVFLSYASQDFEAASRIRDALRASGIEVWFDHSELAGGDAWDAKIRGQINGCALFVPVISANTNARLEGYFRREWKLAVERTHGMDDRMPFLLPVVIDDTSESTARVPDRFFQNQWTRVPLGIVPDSFVAHLRNIMNGERPALIDATRRGPADVSASVRSMPGRSRRPAWIALGAVVILVAVILRWQRKPPTGILDGTAGHTEKPVPSVNEKSIAVLPFANFSDDKQNAYFADGVQEDILTSLAGIGEMNVISRTSVMAYRDTQKSVQQVAAELGVLYVLEGSVRKAGNKVRVSGQLISAKTGLQVWAQSYDRDMDDIFAIQSALAKDIAQALHAVLTPRDIANLDRKPTDNAEAYDLFLQGRAAYSENLIWPDKIAKARPLLERAVALDPNYAGAWLELNWVYDQMLEFNPSSAIRAKKNAALQNAVRLAPDDVDVMRRELDEAQDGSDKAMVDQLKKRIALASPGYALEFQIEDAERRDDPQVAAALLEKQRALDPRDADLWDTSGRFYADCRKFPEAEAAFRQMIALEPPSYWNSFRLALVPFWADGNRVPAETFLASLPEDARYNDPSAIAVQAGWYYITGDGKDLIDLWKRSGTNWTFLVFSHRMDKLVVGMAYLSLGENELAKPILIQNRDELLAQIANAPDDVEKIGNLFQTYAMLGDMTAANEWVDRSVKAAPNTREGLSGRLMWSGLKSDKDDAVAQLEKNMHKKIRDVWGSNTHEAARQLWNWPLWSDPRFEAIVNDPKNNLPAF